MSEQPVQEKPAPGRKDNPRVPPPLVMVAVGVPMWLLAQFLPVGQVSVPGQVPLAILLLGAGILLMLWAVAFFVKVKTTVNPLRPARASSLVTGGAFRLSRNPIYLGDLLVLAALVVWLGNVFNVALLALFVWYINRFQILPEERALTGLFGEEYLDYCRRVRRWL